MKKQLLATLALALFLAPAQAQLVMPGGGGGGAGSITSVASTCPATSASSGAATVPNGVTSTAQSSAYSVLPADCGKLLEVTGTTPITLPPFSGGTAVGSGFNVGVMNADATHTVTVAASSGSINSGGSLFSTVTLSPGQTMMFVVNAAVTGWDGSTGPTGATGATGPAGPNITGPGATAPNVWYIPFGMAGNVVASGTINNATVYCTPGWVSNILAAGGGGGTLNGLGARVTGVGTTNIQLAIYANDATVTPYRPGALIANTSNILNTSVAPVSGTVSATSITSPALYWFCLETNDSSVRWLAKNSAAPDLFFNVTVGSASLATSLQGGGGVSTGSTFGTWPSSLHGSTWTETTSQAPVIVYSFGSIP